MSEAIDTLFIGHEATRTGAPIGFLSLIQWLQEKHVTQPSLWLKNGGPLVAAHAALGPLGLGANGDWPNDVIPSVRLAYLNTATLGSHAEALAEAGVPVICHVHEMEFGLRATGENNLAQLCKHVTKFIACSNAVKDALVRVLGVSTAKIHVVPECVDVDRAQRLASIVNETPSTTPSTRVLCGMGTVNWRKGVDLFLRVLAHLRSEPQPWRGVWIGDFESSPDREQLLHDIRVLGLNDHIEFTGSIANPFPHLAQADVFCLTSREDPYPLAMVEAAALGKPIIGFRNSGGVEEFVAEAGGSIVDYADTKAMAEAVQHSCPTSESTAQHARDAARRLCSPDAVGAAIAQIIQAVAAPRGISFNDAVVKRLRQASQPTSQSTVRVLEPGAGAQELACSNCSTNAEDIVQWSTSWPQSEGNPLPSIVIAIEPQHRSMIIRQPHIRLVNSSGIERVSPSVKIRTSGRAMACSDDSTKRWLCLDGKGRLLLDVTLPEPNRCDLTIKVTWLQTTNVKDVLRAKKSNPSDLPVPKKWWKW